MPYSIYKSDGTAVTVPDNAIDTQYYNPTGGGGIGGSGNGQGTQLIGRNAIDYGAATAQNFLQLTENFCSNNFPSDSTALQGQLWFNQLSSTSGNLYVRTTNNTSGGSANWARLAQYTDITSGLPSATTSQLYGGSGSAGVATVVSLGSGLSLSGNVLSATSSGGSVTSVSVTSANGFAGSVATSTTTPAITLSTTITGLLKGNGTAISAATAGTDYVSPGASNTFATTQIFNGSASGAAIIAANAIELVNVVSSAPVSVQNFFVSSDAVQYYTSNNANNWTINFAWSSGTTMNTALGIGQSVTVAMIVTNGATAYYPTAFQIDGSSVTPKWQGATAPTAGHANNIDVYTFTIIKTASSTYTVLAAQTEY